MLQHQRPLTNGQPDTWPMLDRRREVRLRLIQIAPRIQHVIDLRAVLGPLLDLVEIAMVRDQRVVGLFGGSIPSSLASRY